MKGPINNGKKFRRHGRDDVGKKKNWEKGDNDEITRQGSDDIQKIIEM